MQSGSLFYMEVDEKENISKKKYATKKLDLSEKLRHKKQNRYCADKTGVKSVLDGIW